MPEVFLPPGDADKLRFGVKFLFEPGDDSGNIVWKAYLTEGREWIARCFDRRIGKLSEVEIKARTRIDLEHEVQRVMQQHLEGRK